MKTEEKSNVPKVRIAVLGQMNVGKSGELKLKLEQKNYFFYLIYFLRKLRTSSSKIKYEGKYFHNQKIHVKLPRKEKEK